MRRGRSGGVEVKLLACGAKGKGVWFPVLPLQYQRLVWFPIWGMKWNVCPSRSYVVSNMRNEMKCLSVCHTWFPIWGMKWNVCPSQSYVVSNMRNEMKCLSVCHTWFPIWEWNEMLSVRLSYVVSNMRNEMKCLSVCHTWFPIWGMKWNVCPSVIRGFQYEEWNEMLSIRL